MDKLRQDIRYALRTLRNNAGFTAIAAITLALGIGANTAIFSVVNSVLLRPLPYPESERLVDLTTGFRERGMSISSMSYPDVLEIRGLTRDFSGVAPYSTQNYNFTAGGEPHEVRAVLASDDLFRVLRTEAAVGRTFTPDEFRAAMVVLSHGLWASEFGSDPTVVGRTVSLDGQTFTVVGVMPRGFQLPNEDPQLWVPLGRAFLADPQGEVNRHFYSFSTIARLAPGATLGQAGADLGVVAQRINAAERDNQQQGRQGQQRLEISMRARGPAGGPQVTRIQETEFVARPLRDDVIGDSRRPILILLGAVALVLLIACANAAGLLIARGTARRKEIAVRQALGASRAQLVRQMLTESVVLALIGGVLGVALSFWGVAALLTLWPAVLPRAQEIGIDGRVLAFALGLSVVTGLAFGLFPAWRTSAGSVEETLRDESGASTGSRARRRAHNLLVGVEVAVALVMLVGSGLLIRSFLRLSSVELGYDTRDVLAARIRLTPSRFPTLQSQADFFERVSDALARNPAVASVSLTRTLPLSGGVQILAFDPRQIRPDYPEPFLASRMSVVGPGYFTTAGIPIKHGRAISPDDRADAPKVAVVNQRLVDILWPEQDPIGRTIPMMLPGSGPTSLTVVGVIGDVHYASLDAPVMPELYLPHLQSQSLRQMWVMLRANGAPLRLASAVREAVQQIDPQQPIGEIVSLDQMVSRSTATRRFNMTLLSVFAALALALSLVGIYGVTAYAVSQRTREMGLRMAIGAQPGDVIRLLMSENLWLLAVGVAVGLAGALGVTRVLRSMLFEVSTTDVLAFLGAAVLLVLATLGATYMPARRAARIDPVDALRHE